MVYKLNRRPSQLDHILHTAAAVIAREGVGALSIDRLAKAAGVTKGGVQYHFDSKAKLETQLLDWLLQRFDEAITHESEGEQDGKSWLRAYVRLSLQPAGEADHAAFSLLASFPPDGPRAEPYRAMARKWRAAATRGVSDAALAHVILLAADAMWLARLDGPQGHEGLDAAGQRLLAMVESLA